MNPLEESIVEIRYTEYNENLKCWTNKQTEGLHFILVFDSSES